MSTRPFTPEELVVLEMLCAGDWPNADIARAQLAVARHAGASHGGGDACFDIEIVGDVRPFDRGGHDHLKGLIVHEGDEVIGMIELSITAGFLDSLEYSWFTADTPTGMPRIDQLWTTEEGHAHTARLRELHRKRSRVADWIRRRMVRKRWSGPRRS